VEDDTLLEYFGLWGVLIIIEILDDLVGVKLVLSLVLLESGEVLVKRGNKLVD